MKRSIVRRVTAIATVIVMPMGVAAAAGPVGSPGIGDPYYPDYGNGGYDVSHYSVNVEYDQPKDVVRGRTMINAKATEALSRFNLDLALRATLVRVNGRPAKFTQSEHELVVTPSVPDQEG